MNKFLLDILFGFINSHEKKIFFFIPFIFLNSLIVSAQDTERTFEWNSMGIPIGLNQGTCQTAIDNNGVLYIAGNFTYAGGVLVNGIAKWDGSNWAPLGNPLNHVGSISCIGIDKHNTLYAGGSFSNLGGTNANRIAKWDGSNWSAIGSGTANGIIRTITFDKNNNLIVSGSSLTMIGGTSVSGIAKWDGVNWTSIYSPYSSIKKIVIDSNDIIYLTSYTTNSTTVHKFDGTSWSDITTNQSNSIYDIQLNNNNELYIGGTFTTIGGVSISGLAKWNGINCSPISNSNITSVSCLKYYNSHLYVVENSFPYKISKWDENSWSSVCSSSPNGTSMAIKDADIYLTGGSQIIDSVFTAGIAHWNGNKWLAFGNGTGSLTEKVEAIAEDENGNIYIGGYFSHIGGKLVNNIAKWDGISWQALGTGVNNRVYALEFDKNGNLFVGGDFNTAGGLTANNIAKWDGNSWDTLKNGVVGRIFAITIDSLNNVYVAGRLYSASGVPVNNVAKWDGNDWTALHSGVNEWCNELKSDANQHIFIGGGFSMAGGVYPCYGLAEWNGTNWDSIGTGLIAMSVRGMTIDNNNNLYISAYGSLGGSAYENGVWKWNGTSWSQLGNIYSTSSGAIYTLTTDELGNVYASGSNISATPIGIIDNNILKWDGTSWTNIGVSIGSSILALKVSKDGCKLYAGGKFFNIGGIPSSNIAWYSLSNTPNVTLDLSANDTVCYTSNSFSLSGGFPTGGTYYGTGVINNQFFPAIAGDGLHTITYVYNDSIECSSYSTGQIYVAICLNVDEQKSNYNPLKIFPNPFSSEINITIEGESFEDYTFSIKNILGESIKFTQNNSVISLSDCPSGIYLIIANEKKGKNKFSKKSLKIKT